MQSAGKVLLIGLTGTCPMTARQPHPQQVLSCDSCRHAEKTNSKTYPAKCLISKPVPMMVHECCISWFGYVGCASHTSASQQRIEQVMDSFDEIINRLQMADGEGESESHQPLIRLGEAMKIVDDIKAEAIALLRGEQEGGDHHE